MTHLYDPLTLRGATLRNRIGVPPMCQYSAEDGFANEWHLVHYGSRAVGGVGLVIVEATAVEPRGRISPNDLGLWGDDHIEPLARVAQFIRQQGAVAGIQIAHAGRKAGTARPWQGRGPVSDADGGWEPVAPSPISFDDGYRTPHALDEAEIQTVQGAFVDAAQRAVDAGFDLVEIHGAHGYLIHSFYSPLTNRRTDRYGGSFDNRIRFPVEITAAVRAAIPEQTALAVRLSTTEWVEGGWSVEDSVALARRLKAEGVDLIDCSSGGIQPGVAIPSGAGYQVAFAEQVRQLVQIPTAAVGLITAPAHADALIRNGRADVVLLGRESLRNPYWALHAAPPIGLSELAPIPNQYRRAF